MAGTAQQVASGEPELATAEDAFAALVARQARFVYRVAWSMLRNVHDAEDVVQETFLRVYRARAWERITDERAFLARAAWRGAVDRLKRGKRESAVEDAPASGANPEQAALTAERNAAVWRLIDTLPEELRQPLALSGIEELSSREIGEIMGIAEGTVRTRLMRARRILREKLSAYER